MKKILLFIAFIVSATAIWAQPQKIAILDIVDKEMQVSYNTKLMLRSYIQDAISQSAAGETLDCADLSGIIDEYEFSRSRQLSAEDVRNIGQSCAAEKILVVEVSQPKVRQLFVMAKLYNTSTGNIEKTANAMIKEKAETMQTGAKELVFTLFKQTNSTNGATTKKSVNSLISSNVGKPRLVHNPAEVRRFRKEFSYGDIDMTEEELLEFLSYQCPEAMYKYIEAKRMITAGWSVLGITCLFGVPIYVPCLALGYKRIDKAIEYFNNNCAAIE